MNNEKSLSETGGAFLLYKNFCFFVPQDIRQQPADLPAGIPIYVVGFNSQTFEWMRNAPPIQ